MYFDKQLNPISQTQWAEFVKDKSYMRIKMDNITKDTFVSTVWLGIDHSFWNGDPIIFETMIFSDQNKMIDWYQKRYSTLEEALQWHQDALDYAYTQINKNSIFKISSLNKDRGPDRDSGLDYAIDY